MADCRKSCPHICHDRENVTTRHTPKQCVCLVPFYHCYSYDAIDYEGEEYGACDEYAVEDDSAEQTARIREAFSHLTATQQRRLRLYANGKTLREIAAIEEASFQSVSESIEAGRKKFLKIFRQTP